MIFFTMQPHKCVAASCISCMKQILFNILVLISVGLKGQTYIDKILPTVGARPGPAVLVDDSSYVVLGTFLVPTEFNIARLDLAGNIIKSRTYTYPSIAVAAPCKKCLKMNRGNLYHAKTHFYRQDSTSVVFTKYSRELDSLTNEEIIQFQGAVPLIYDLQFDTDSTFVVSGLLYRNKAKHDLWVGRFDTNFIPLWQKRVEDNYPNLFFGYRENDIEVDNYGSVLVTGRWYGHENAITNINYGSFAARLDIKTGDLHWIKEFTGPAGSFDMAALDEGNGTYAFVQHQFLTSFPGTPHPDTTQIRFGKLDTTGVVLWDTAYARHRGQFYFSDMQKTLDGNYYIAGQDPHAPRYDFSSGFKFSPAGDSLWYRQYHHQDSIDDSYIWSFAPTSDTGFVHFGVFIDNDNDYDPQRLQYSWLLKTDKHGCTAEGCETIGLKEKPANELRIEVYPNPSSGKFVLDIVAEAMPEKLQAQVYDAVGNRVYETMLQNNRSEIDISHLPSGMYMLHLKNNNGLIHTQKLLFQ